MTEHPPVHAVLVRPAILHNTGAIGRTSVALGGDLALMRPVALYKAYRQISHHS